MQLSTNPLSANKQTAVRRLLDSDGFPVLLEVLRSKAFEHEVEVANASLNATTGYDQKAKENAQRAIAVHAAIAILIEMFNSDGKSNFLISTATPTEKHTTKK